LIITIGSMNKRGIVGEFISYIFAVLTIMLIFLAVFALQAANLSDQKREKRELMLDLFDDSSVAKMFYLKVNEDDTFLDVLKESYLSEDYEKLEDHFYKFSEMIYGVPYDLVVEKWDTEIEDWEYFIETMGGEFIYKFETYLKPGFNLEIVLTKEFASYRLYIIEVIKPIIDYGAPAYDSGASPVLQFVATGEYDEYNDMLYRASTNANIDPYWFKALIKHESGFRPNVMNGGCVGLTQVCPSSAKLEFIKKMGGKDVDSNTDFKKESFCCAQSANEKNNNLGACYEEKNACPSSSWCPEAGYLCSPTNDDRFDPEKNLFSGALTLYGKVNSVGECGADKLKAWTAAYNLGQKYIKLAIKANGGKCDSWDNVFAKLVENVDFDNEIIFGDHKTYSGGMKHKIYNLEGKPKGHPDKPKGDYLGKIFATYESYLQKAALASPGMAYGSQGVKFMTFNIRYGRWGETADAKKASFGKAIELIKQFNPDVLALQEVGRDRPYYFNVDQFEKLKTELGMQGEFAETIKYNDVDDVGQFGIAILSKTPLTEKSDAFYPTQTGEKRKYQRAKTTVGGKEFTIYNTHLHHSSDGSTKATTVAQIQELHDLVAKDSGNVVVLGDFNNNKEVLDIFEDYKTDGNLGETYSTKKAVDKRDYIFYTSGLSKSSTQIVKSQLAKEASDHYPIVIEFAGSSSGFMSSVLLGAKSCVSKSNALITPTQSARVSKYAEEWKKALDAKEVYGTSWMAKFASNGLTDDRGLSEPGRLTAIFAPCTLDTTKPIEIMYYFHGIYAFGFPGLSSSFDDFNKRIAPQLKELMDTGRNFVLVFPEMPWSGGDEGQYYDLRKDSGWRDYLWVQSKDDSNLATLHGDVLSQLQEQFGSVNVGFISMTGQSAGGRPMAQAAKKGALGEISVNKITFSDADYSDQTKKVYDYYVKDHSDVELNMLVQAPTSGGAHRPTYFSINFVKALGVEGWFAEDSAANPKWDDHVKGDYATPGAVENEVFSVPGHNNVYYVPLTKGHAEIGEMSLAWVNPYAKKAFSTDVQASMADGILLPEDKNPYEAGVPMNQLMAELFIIFDSTTSSKRHYDHVVSLDGATVGMGHWPQSQTEELFAALKSDTAAYNAFLKRAEEYTVANKNVWNELLQVSGKTNLVEALDATLFSESFMSKYSNNCRISCAADEPDLYHENQGWFPPLVKYGFRDSTVVKWTLNHYEDYLLGKAKKYVASAGIKTNLIPAILGFASATSSASSWGSYLGGAYERGYIEACGDKWKWNEHPFIDKPTQEQLDSWRLVARWQYYASKKNCNKDSSDYSLRNREFEMYKKYLAQNWKIGSLPNNKKDPKNWDPDHVEMLTAVGSSTNPETCTYTDKGMKNGVKFSKKISKPYSELESYEKDDSGCTLCEEDQVKLEFPSLIAANVEGAKDFKVCKVYAAQVKQAIDKIIADHNFKIEFIKGYRQGRTYSGSTKFGMHPFGLAVDLNFDNNGLYDECKTWGSGCVLKHGGAYKPEDPTVAKLTIKQGTAPYNSFKEIGWIWGGDWSKQKDFMHFSANGK
jgi:endonuclease/exonuclease/phosphatase family metal-dependent hydrolase